MFILQECEYKKREAESEDIFEIKQTPLYVAFYKLNQALDDLGPSYLGLKETADELDKEKQPWTIPTKLTVVNEPTSEHPETVAMMVKEPVLAHKGETKDLYKDPMDIPALIRLLIEVENTRRYFTKQLIQQRHQTGGPLGDQSERWQHGIAKRNIAAETRFERFLVALKELVVLRAIVDEETAEIGELRQVLGEDETARGRKRRRDEGGHGQFDATKCMAILNLMFPLNRSPMDRLAVLDWNQQYDYPLQHVSNPRTRLHQLLCEVEAWVNGDERVTVNTELGSEQQEKNVERLPENHPAWRESARGFGWGLMLQRCQSYLDEAQHKIALYHRTMNPLVDPREVSSSTSSSELADDARTMLEQVSQKCSADSTVLERIICHSELTEK